MTLLIHYSFRDEFILITSDTAKRKQYFDPISLEANGGFGESVETKDKMIKVSDTVCGTIGGLMSIGYVYLNRLLSRVKPGDCLEVCEGYLSEIIQEINAEEQDDFFGKYHVSEEYQVTLAGYHTDGTPGIVAVIKGEIVKGSGIEISTVFSPTVEVGLISKDIISVCENLYVSSGEISNVITHFAHFQGAVSYTHPELVSSTMLYMGFIRGIDGTIVPFEGEVDLKDVVASFKKEGELNASEE